MEPTWQSDCEAIRLFNADCREAMRGMEAGSIDSIVTDPPYGLSFMGKGWDHGVPGTEFWEEALRVAKPGAHLLAFGGTRTFHRLACAIEDAGWEIRDCIMWVYGSGFPKSLDVSKAIDKCGGESLAWFGAWFRQWRQERGISSNEVAKLFPSAMGGITGCVRNWELGLNLPSPEQFVLLKDMFDLPFSNIEEAKRKIVGKKPWNNSQSHFVPGEDHSQRVSLDITAPATEAAKQWQGWGTALKPSWEPIIVARKPIVGNVAANVLQHGTGGINVDGCRVGTNPEVDDPRLGGKGDWSSDKMAKNVYEGGYAGERVGSSALGRFPANLIHDGSEEVVELFPITTSGTGAKQGGSSKGYKPNAYGSESRPAGTPCVEYGDTGSASRFFYCAKASKSDREEGNTHPTVKPTALMRYLCRLVTPPGGVVLDSFMGSGSTGKAALLEGFQFVGCDSDTEHGYFEIAKSRTIAAKQKQKAERKQAVQGSMFD